ncbi:hypothetical protein TNCV_4735331 [Trichonephila clavipes]|nr:hypothetical protein TNCV_4735331 [Trichonephila clavipes]
MFRGTRLELMTRHPRVRYLDHYSTTAPPLAEKRLHALFPTKGKSHPQLCAWFEPKGQLKELNSNRGAPDLRRGLNLLSNTWGVALKNLTCPC